MLVFGDRSEHADPSKRLATIGRGLGELETMAGGLARHSAIAALLIDSGCLLQGFADADFQQAGEDSWTPQTDALGSFVLGFARMLCRSWDSGFSEFGEAPPVPQISDAPETVQLKTPEGFAFYAVYPEAYIEAARRLRLIAPPRVIGIRSIGTTLGSVVAAALDAEPPGTVRPFGDPFARRVAVDAGLERRLLDGEAHYILVDEGPGQSGSSFGAVADWLQQRGVPLERIAFLPSHGGAPGEQASRAHRQRWDVAQREIADFGDRLPQLVAQWASGLIGPVDREPDDLSAGEWRRLAFASGGEWPPAIATFERRKILLAHGNERFLAKFAGLGGTGEAKLRMAQTLFARGFVAEPVGLAHGFLVERWRGDAKPLPASDRPMRAIGDYLGARARLFPATAADGASIAELYAMARRNVSLGLGEDAARALYRWEPRVAALQRRVRPVRTDNRLDRHEWLRRADGRLLKADALDHHQAHDLIGCQDLAWDVAGAMVEFDLETEEAERFIAASEQAWGTILDRELLGFCLVAYPAFRLGLASIGAGLASGDAAERGRLLAAEKRYRRKLQLLLECSSPATRQESLVG